ncbi:MAG: thioredoxin family protein [Planctomycetes bacterium]|nr:thioredoxin family protein [Planctomycetota bacterium]
MSTRARWFPGLVWLLSLAAPLLAQDGRFTLTAAFAPAQAKPGDTVQLVLSASVAPGWHAYGAREGTNVPVALKPTRLQLAGLELAGPAVVPPGEPKTVFGVETFPLPNEFVVRQPLRVPAGMAGGGVTVQGALDYQLCDANSCLPPAKATFTATLQVEGAAAEPALAPGLRLEPEQKLAVAARLQPSVARAGEALVLVLDVLVDDRYHAYGTKETTNLPVAVDPAKLQLGGLEVAGPAVVPPGERKQVFGVDSYPLPQRFEVRQPLLVPAGTAPGRVELRGVLDYQLCDENSCELPAAIGFAAAIEIEPGSPRAPAAPAVDEIPPAGGSPLAGSLWALLLACIGGGLFALVMPCTYPMIPITFSFFTKQADARGGRVLPLALAYGAGIVVMFGLIGALAGVLGGYLVPFAAHWSTNLVIGAAFVLFGLSLVGVIDLQPPAFLVGAAGRTRSVGGLVGVLLMGATLVVTSFTCTAPVVALLLLPAVQSGDTLRPTLGMTVFGLTMATPFVFLALLPGRVRSLPRSGEWMQTLKVSLGVIELAAALKFFSNAEYVEELYILPREVFFGVWIVLFAGLGVWLLGLLPRRAVGNGRRAGGLGSLVFAGYCLYGALGYPLDFVMTALAPAYGARDVSAHEVVVDDYEAAAARARAQGKLVLVNLSGFTCTNCRMVERGILPDPAIAPLLARHFVEARLHMDNPAVIAPDKWERHAQLRRDLVGEIAPTPSYAAVDPRTGKALGQHVLSGGPGAWLGGYEDFLRRALASAGR